MTKQEELDFLREVVKKQVNIIKGLGNYVNKLKLELEKGERK